MRPDNTKRDLDIIKKYNNGEGSTSIAKSVGIHENSIMKILKKYNVPIRSKKQNVFDKDHEEIVRLYKSGLSTTEVGEIYNVSNTRIIHILEKAGCTRRPADETHRKYPINEDFFDDINSPEKAYVLGYAFADAYNCRQGNYTSFTAATKDRDVLSKVGSLLYKNDSDIHVKSYERFRDLGKGPKTYYESKIVVNSKHICQKLHDLGCEQGKSLTCAFPKSLADEELQRHFIRGYYDGDGGLSISSEKGGYCLARIVGTTSFMEKIMDIVKTLGVNFHVEKVSEHLIRPAISGNQQCKVFLDWLYKDSTIHLDRKYNLYQELLAKMAGNSRTREGMVKINNA